MLKVDSPIVALRHALRRALAAGVLLLALAADGAAQEPEFRFRGRGGRNMGADPLPNAPYDGRFTFARIRFTPASRGWGFGGGLMWDHDYPRAERNFMRILDATTYLTPYLEGGNIYALDDPELTRYPVAYICEVGFWTMTDAEVRGLRGYLLKGGFIIVDDFSGGDWNNFIAQLRRALPDVRPVPLDVSHPLFHSFFEIESLELTSYRGQQPVYLGVFEDNDPSKRLMMVINYNNDIGDYWEWSDAGFLPIELSNEAYKLGVNYVVYAMTH